MNYDNTSDETLDIYFKYENLDIEMVLKLFKNLNRIHGFVMSTTSPVYFNEYEKNTYRNTLALSEINTGQSIRIKFSEKWKVELPFNIGRIQGTSPKKLGVPLIIAAFILIAARQAIGVYNEYLEVRINELDLKLKENELYLRMEERKRIDPAFRNAAREAATTVNYILENSDIGYFEINGVNIKDGR